ncbi:MAG: hypothetical protein ACREOH_19065 [Candidatus Entotheonellia bacterium]
MLRVYDLQPASVRLESPIVCGHWTVMDDGLFLCGDSQDHYPRPATGREPDVALELLSMPMAT